MSNKFNFHKVELLKAVKEVAKNFDIELEA